MLYSHWREAIDDIDWQWENFKPYEFACPHCGEFFYDPHSFDLIQSLREAINRPIYLNSAHRCWLHNARVRGAPLSQHKRIAFDINLHNHNRFRMFDLAKQVGFGSFGFYQTFLHADIRPGRRWYASKKAKQIWNGQL